MIGLVLVSQLLVTIITVSVALGTQADAVAAAYGALLGVVTTLLILRSTDRTLQTAVENPTHGIITMFSGLALRYSVAVLGFLVGFKILYISAELMTVGFILTIAIPVLVVTFVSGCKLKKEKCEYGR